MTRTAQTLGAALLLGVTLVPLTASPRAAAATAAETPADVPRIPFTRTVLPNGLEVILHPDRRVPLVAVDVWYHVGSGNETPGKSGFAHLFEHMMFQGAKHIGQDAHFDVLRKLGVASRAELLA